jgi:hypothetical protein
MTTSLGSAFFGPLVGSFGTLQMAMPNGAVPLYPFFVLNVNPGTNHAYQVIGYGMSQAQFKAWSAAVVKIPRP